MLALALLILSQTPETRVTRVERVEYERAAGGRTGSAACYPVPYDVQWTATGTMGSTRLMGQAVALSDGRVLVEGGLLSGGGVATTTELYQSNGSWVTTGARTYKVRGGADVVLDDGRVLACGGYADGTTTTETHCELWNPSDGGWETTGSMSVGRYQFQMLKLNDGRVLALGDTNQAAALAGTEVWNPDSGLWSDAGTMNYARRAPVAVKLADGRVYVHGGARTDSVGLPNAEIWSPDAGAWANVLSSGDGYALSAGVLLDDGRVMIAGGTSHLGSVQPPVYRAPMIYDPSLDSYTVIATDGGLWRTWHGIAKLPGGNVLVTGGEYHSSGSTELGKANSYVWDRDAGTWSDTSSMVSPRFYMAKGQASGTLPQLSDGRVLAIGGGTTDSTVRVATTEVYQPEATWCARTQPYFSFAPESGAGLSEVTAKPLPNWALQSEALNDAVWTSQFSPSAITVTPNASGTMERLQIPATSGAAQYALLYQLTQTLTGSVTISADVQGVGGTSGTFKLGAWNGSTFSYGDCAFTGTLSRCSVTVNIGNATATRVYLGNDSANIVGNPAQTAVDVYVGALMFNVGSTAAPYVATTTAAKGYTVTGAKGEAMTFSRTGVAYATNGTGGALRTTNINNGDLVLMPGNQPRVVPDLQGKLKLYVEGARTNDAQRSQELDNAYWTKGGGAVVTANYGAAPDGTMTADRVQVSACPVAGNFSVVYNTSIRAATTAVGSVYCRGTSASQTISVCTVSSPPTGVCAQVTCPSTSWTRIAVQGNAATVGLVMGCDNEPAGYAGVTNTGAADVLLWQAQLEAGSYVTSPIVTTSASAARNAEGPAYFTPASTFTPACVSGTAQVAWTTANSNRRVVRVDSNNADNDRFDTYIGTGTAAGVAGVCIGGTCQSVTTSTATLPGLFRLVGRRTPSVTQTGSMNSYATTASTALGAFPVLNRVHVGAYPLAGGFEADGLVGEVQADTDPLRCR